MARDLAAKIPDIDIPESLVAEVEPDHDAGVAAACEQILILRGSGAFDGVHLVPVSRYQQVAALLERELWTPGNTGTFMSSPAALRQAALRSRTPAAHHDAVDQTSWRAIPLVDATAVRAA